jgi:hypothetical protein
MTSAKLSHRERLTTQLIDRTSVALAGQHRRGGLGIVSARGRAYLASAGRADDAALEVDRQLAGVVPPGALNGD